VRKIISILVALGLVLTFSVVAMPAATGAATTTCTANVTLSSECAGVAGVTYTVDFVATKTLLAGNDKLSFGFDGDTTFGTTVTVTIDVGGGPVAVPAASISKAAPDLDFVVPVQVDLNDVVAVVITGVKNPTTAGAMVLTLDYEFACCGPEDFDCADYTIKPDKSTYKYILDFGPTFPGIAEDFIPPFQACGQVGYGNYSTDLNATIDVGWMDKFDVTLIYDVLGCNGGCTANVSNMFYVKSGPEDATISMFLGDEGMPYNWPPTFYQITLDDDWDPEVAWGQFPTFSFPLAADHNATSQGWIHFDTPGDYEICFQLECPDVEEPCEATIEGGILAEYCVDAKVYQWKEAFKIPLYAKWNLVSLPFRPLESDIATQLESLSFADKVMAIWHFDQCADEWVGYPGHGLTDMVDGDSYWIRLPYTTDAATAPPAGTYLGDWWVFGTDRPYEEAPVPFNYEVCKDWNMVGFTPVWDMTATPHAPLSAPDGAYLWNWWNVFSAPEYGLIYGWAPATQTWATQMPGFATLLPGDGYWISFIRDGTINP